MARTHRKVNPSTARFAKQIGGRRGRMLLKGAKHFKPGRCCSAATDAEGGHKLNTWDTHPGPSGNLANKAIRRAGKTLIERQLED